eukprot:m.56995 g.56995  ORF g.56995 m.56995 type:complete len:297 (-) comp11072_c0_seq1:773-1663(-)
MSASASALKKCESKLVNRRKGESAEEYVGRLTHISAVNQNITELVDLRMCKMATTVFLYNNKIGSLKGIEMCKRLTHVCLQHNRINHIEHLSSLTLLRKLRLGYNHISVFEGLEGCTNLEEIHMEKQDLPDGESLVFDPRCLRALSSSLRYLDVSGNRIQDIKDLTQLRKLQYLNIAENNIENMQDVEEVLQANRSMESLWINRNPVCSIQNYQNIIIIAGVNLKTIDSNQINNLTRQFLYNMKNRLRVNTGKRGIARDKGDSVFIQMHTPKFPSKFSSRNPHFVAPLPLKRNAER